MRGFTLISKACDLVVLSLLLLRKRSCKQSLRPCGLKGFTLIELLVVIAIMAILVVVAVPSYNEYNNNQKLAEAANQLQTVLRQAQNNAQTGTVCKPSLAKALYWHVDLSTGSNTSYSFSATCEGGGSTSAQVTPLPSGVAISSIIFKDYLTDVGCSPVSAQIQFTNVKSEVRLFDSVVPLGCYDGINRYVEITLSLNGSDTNIKTVRVEKGGGIYVKDE